MSGGQKGRMGKEQKEEGRERNVEGGKGKRKGRKGKGEKAKVGIRKDEWKGDCPTVIYRRHQPMVLIE